MTFFDIEFIASLIAIIVYIVFNLFLIYIILLFIKCIFQSKRNNSNGRKIEIDN